MAWIIEDIVWEPMDTKQFKQSSCRYLIAWNCSSLLLQASRESHAALHSLSEGPGPPHALRIARAMSATRKDHMNVDSDHQSQTEHRRSAAFGFSRSPGLSPFQSDHVLIWCVFQYFSVSLDFRSPPSQPAAWEVQFGNACSSGSCIADAC